MNIGIDLLSESPESAGPKVYTQNLLKSLAKIDDRNKYFIFVGHRNLEDYWIEKRNFEYVPIRLPEQSAPLRRTWEQICGPLLVRQYRVDLFHSINNVIPLFTKLPSVVTIHDVAPFEMKNRFSKLKELYLKRFVPYTAKRANRIITVSENTKRELLKYCQVDAWKIIVVHNGIAPIFLKTKNSKDTLPKWIAPKPYLLYVGTLEPGKNIVRLVKAFMMMGETIKKDYKLVVAGRKGWMYKDLLRTVENLDAKKRVLFTGYVPYKYLPALYKDADVFVFPSLYEGFGLPVLEAMACGTPVVTSNTSSLPEVVGDSAMLVNPYDTKELATAIEKILTDKKLRSKLVSKGFERVKLFSWEKCAKETLKVYEEVYHEKIGDS